MRPTFSKFSALVAAATAVIAVSAPAHALTNKECSAKYAAAKAAGTLAGKKWNEFRSAECTSDAASNSAKPAAVATNANTAKADVKPVTSAQESATKSATTAPKNVPSATKSASGAVFPSVIATAYAKESTGKARMHTCLDQYKANKASNANGGMKWIQKDGGYYSECNKQLKG